MVLFDVPRKPLISLEALQHANIGRYTFDPTYIIGNSFPPARINDLTKIYRENYVLGRDDVWDLSYLLNQQLWDSYYFSSIPADITAEQLAQLVDGEAQLPNHRLRFVPGDGLSVDLLTSDEAEDHTFYKTASYMMIEGAFNINSTSVEAWEAFLASSRDLAIPLLSSLDNPRIPSSAPTSKESDAVFSRLFNPIDGHFSGGNENRFWRGYRALGDSEIRNLAAAIVARIKARGRPAASLAEFVNRPLESAPSSGLAKAGLLQEPEVIAVRFSVLSLGDSMRGLYYDVGSDRREIFIPNASRSIDYHYRGPEQIVFYVPEPGPEGSVLKRPVASIDLGRFAGGQVLLLFSPDGDSGRYRVWGVNDAVGDFPGMSWRVFNLANSALALKVGNDAPRQVSPGEYQTFTATAGTSDSRRVQIATNVDGGWHLAYDSIWSSGPQMRTLVFVIPETNGGIRVRQVRQSLARAVPE